MPILAVFVAAAIGLAVIAMRDAASVRPLRHEIATLQDNLGALTGQLAAEQRTVARAQATIASLRRAAAHSASAGNVNRLSVAVDRLGADVRMFQVCVPQLRREMESLQLVVSNVNGWLTGVKVMRPVGMSAACASALAGPAR